MIGKQMMVMMVPQKGKTLKNFQFFLSLKKIILR